MLDWLRRWHQSMLWVPLLRIEKTDEAPSREHVLAEATLKDMERRLRELERRVDKIVLFDGHG